MTGDSVLLVTTSYDEAAGYLERELNRRRVRFFRLDSDRFPGEISATFEPGRGLQFVDDTQQISGEDVRSVWYRRHHAPILPPGLESGVVDFCNRECRSFLLGALAALPTKRWLSAPEAIWRAERKPLQLAIAAELGMTLPHTLVTNDSRAVLSFSDRNDLIAKAVSYGYVKGSKGNHAIFSSEISPEDLSDLRGLKLAPVIFQEHVKKAADIRVTVVGDRVFAAEILSQRRDSSRVDWRATDDPNLIHRRHDLPCNVEQQCRELLSALRLGFGAIDFALTPKGEYVFFEINPNGEWIWIEDQLQYPIAGSIADWLT